MANGATRNWCPSFLDTEYLFPLSGRRHLNSIISTIRYWPSLFWILKGDRSEYKTQGEEWVEFSLAGGVYTKKEESG